jgi:transposase
MRSLPEAETVAKHRLQDNMSFTAIGQRYGVSRQAVHKMYRRWAEKQGLAWRTRRVPATQD